MTAGAVESERVGGVGETHLEEGVLLRRHDDIEVEERALWMVRSSTDQRVQGEGRRGRVDRTRQQLRRDEALGLGKNPVDAPGVVRGQRHQQLLPGAAGLERRAGQRNRGLGEGLRPRARGS